MVTLQIPPLRARRGDVLHLWRHFIEKEAEGEPPRLSAAAEDKLLGHPWPGNVRELANVAERTLLRRQGSTLRPEEIVFDEGGPTPTLALPEGYVDTRGKDIKAITRDALAAVMRLHHGRRKPAARQLGWTPYALRRKLAELGLETEGRDDDGEDPET